ncbi:hypothetical protein GBF38_004046, partial [Nibea albiflora]
MISARWVVEVEVEVVGGGVGREQRRGGTSSWREEGRTNKKEKKKKRKRRRRRREGSFVRDRQSSEQAEKEEVDTSPGFGTAPHSSTESSAQESDPRRSQIRPHFVLRVQACAMGTLQGCGGKHRGGKRQT